MKNYFKSLTITIISIVLSIFLITVLHYFNIISDSFNNILKFIIPQIIFFICSIKFGKRNKKNTIRLVLPIIILFLCSILFNEFNSKIFIYYSLFIILPLLPCFLKKKIID